MELDHAIAVIVEEMWKATKQYGPLNSCHEGFAVIKEEVDELWEEIKYNPNKPRDMDKVKAEAIQVGAMAIRFLVDLCE